MNNLYRIIVGHAAPKDWHLSTVAYVIAKDDEAVYEWLKKEPEINGSTLFSSWADKEEEEEVFEVYDNEYNVIGTETFKQKIIRLKGEVNDEDYDFSDSYYGITLYGWELVSEAVSGLEKAIELGVVVDSGQPLKSEE